MDHFTLFGICLYAVTSTEMQTHTECDNIPTLPIKLLSILFFVYYFGNRITLANKSPSHCSEHCDICKYFRLTFVGSHT